MIPTDKQITELMDIRKHIMKDVDSNVSEKDFLKSMMFLTPQSYGAKLQKKITDDLGAESVSGREDRGDAKLNNKYYEIKTSILTNVNNNINIVQIRMHQALDYFICHVYDMRDITNYISYKFRLTYKQMDRELHKNLPCSYAHGTIETNKQNKNVEYRVSINPDSIDFDRWISKYSY